MVSDPFILAARQHLAQLESLLQQRRLLFGLTSLIQAGVDDPGQLAMQEAHHALEGVDGVDAAGSVQVGIAVGQDNAKRFVLQFLPLGGLEGIPAVHAELQLGAKSEPVDGTGQHDGIRRGQFRVKWLHVVFDDAAAAGFLAQVEGVTGTDVQAVQVDTFDLRAGFHGAGGQVIRQGGAVAPFARAAFQDEDFVWT